MPLAPRAQPTVIQHLADVIVHRLQSLISPLVGLLSYKREAGKFPSNRGRSPFRSPFTLSHKVASLTSCLGAVLLRVSSCGTAGCEFFAFYFFNFIFLGSPSVTVPANF